MRVLGVNLIFKHPPPKPEAVVVPVAAPKAVPLVAAPVAAPQTITTEVVTMSFFSRIKGWIEKVFHSAPKWESVAYSTLTYTAPLIETAVALADPVAAPVVTNIINVVKADMATVAVTLQTAGATPTVGSLLNAITQNLGALEAAAEIKDPATLTKFTAIVNTVSGEIQAIIAELPASAKAPALSAPAAA